MISEEVELARWPAGPLCTNQLQLPHGLSLNSLRTCQAGIGLYLSLRLPLLPSSSIKFLHHGTSIGLPADPARLAAGPGDVRLFKTLGDSCAIRLKPT